MSLLHILSVMVIYIRMTIYLRSWKVAQRIADWAVGCFSTVSSKGWCIVKEHLPFQNSFPALFCLCFLGSLSFVSESWRLVKPPGRDKADKIPARLTLD